MPNLDDLFAQLAESSFRRSFHLRGKELQYLRDKSLDIVLQHAADFIETRLAPAFPANDGKQTPYRNHPVFIAQHATATCCRSCLEKWHGISKGTVLDQEDKDYIVAVIRRWLLIELQVRGEMN